MRALSQAGSLITCGLHWIIWREWRSLCWRFYHTNKGTRLWRIARRYVGRHVVRSYKHHRNK